jgi:L-ascorbate metabolism protein UlaG (beta-lactamase superfamily)
MKFLINLMSFLLMLGVFAAVIAFIALQQPSFGKDPAGDRLLRLQKSPDSTKTLMQYVGQYVGGERLLRIQKSPQYRDGSFQNASPTPMMSDDVSYWELLLKFLNNSGVQSEPPGTLPAVETDLKLLVKNADPDRPQIVWFGHSTYLLLIGGKTMLVDPVLSKFASPFQFVGAKRFDGTGILSAIDLPPLDVVLLTHDHYDHLDYETIMQLKGKTKHFYASLGVGSHLEHWGIPPSAITEYDWWETGSIADGIKIIATPARHFAGRSFVRNKTLWSSFVIKTAQHTLYLGGDSGYDTHFKTIGEKYGPFDIAILECGQYNSAWRLIHMMPEETVQAAQDLQAKVLMPVHWGKFSLALHAWDEPVRRVTAEAVKRGVPTATPMLGEVVRIGGSTYPTTPWWENVR